MSGQIIHPSDLPRLDQVQAAYRVQAADDFMLFARGLTIDAKPPQLFDDAVHLYQLKYLQALAPSLHAVRDGRPPPIRYFWDERTKKAGKDSDNAIALIWLLAFPTRPTYFQVGAADRDQAGIVKDRMRALLHYNPWLQEQVEIVQWQVRHRSQIAKLDIMAADIAGAHGATPDLLLVNELSHISKWEFAQNLLSNAAGVPTSVTIIATNAGYQGTKQHVLRQAVIKSKDWHVNIRSKPAPWVTEEALRNERLMDPSPSRFDRLWRGVWASGKGDALAEADIDRCFASGARQHAARREGWQYVAGLDLGVSRDHAGLVALAVEPRMRRIELAWMRGYEPADHAGGQVDLRQVREDCKALHERYRLDGGLWYDPHQAALMQQDLTADRVPCYVMEFSSSRNLEWMATSLVECMRDGVLACWDDPDGRLRRDFGKFSIVEKPRGLKLEAVRDEFGHADVGTALVIALPQAVEMMEGRLGRLGPNDDLATDGEDLTEKEVETMPGSLREIYEFYSERGR